MKIFLSVSFLLFFGITAILGTLLYKEKTFLQEVRQENERLSYDLQNLYTEQFYREKEYISAGKMLKPLMLVNPKQQLIPVEEITAGRDKLIFYFSDIHCEVCIEQQINNLREYIPSEHVIIFIKAFNRREISRLEHSKQINCPVFQLKDNTKEILPELDAPYFFILQKENMRMNSLFIPEKENNKATVKYLEEVKEKYFR